MNFAKMSFDELEAARIETEAEIMTLKNGGAPEDGPRLGALRQRRANIIAAIAAMPSEVRQAA